MSGSSISLGGRLTVEAGLMNVDGGTLGAASIHMITLSSGSSTGTLNINGSTVNNSAETVVCDGQNAGTSGQGTLNVNSGSILNSELACSYPLRAAVLARSTSRLAPPSTSPR